MKRLIITFVVLLAACSHDPVITTAPVEVKIPVPVPCKIRPVDKPIYNFPTLKKEDNIFTKIQVLLADRELQKAYDLQLEAAIKECQ
jgi:hypothetical protein